MSFTRTVHGDTYADPVLKNGEWVVAITVDYFSPRIEKKFPTEEEARAFIREKTGGADPGAK